MRPVTSLGVALKRAWFNRLAPGPEMLAREIPFLAAQRGVAAKALNIRRGAGFQPNAA